VGVEIWLGGADDLPQRHASEGGRNRILAALVRDIYRLRGVVVFQIIGVQGNRIQDLTIYGESTVALRKCHRIGNLRDANGDEIPFDQGILPGVGQHVIHESLRQIGIGAVIGDGNRIGGNRVQVIGDGNDFHLIGDVRGDIRGVDETRVRFAERDFGRYLPD